MIMKIASVVISGSCFLYTCYILCNLTYFLSNQNVTPIVDIPGKSETSVTWALLIDISLISIFMLQHSLMATENVKHIFCKFQIDHMNRSVYNVVSALCLHLLMWNWQYIPSVSLWRFNTDASVIVWYIFTGLHVLAWSIIYSVCLMMDISDLGGLKQVYYKIFCLSSPIEAKSRELLRYYSHMRHPSFVGFLVIFWLHPFMSIDRLLLALTLTIYMASMWTIDQEDYYYHSTLVQRKKIELS